MASTMMNIPQKINVGYQERGGTYTGKLAYVVYTDAKGKLRKEKSWTGWCSDKIKKDEFVNEPMDGFVLNKGVGGTRESYGWNARNEYIRVYDPRDFEFEISVANLLFILQECSSIKGKGLEGEFIFAWDGTELVLLPTCSKEYGECVKYTENQATKVTKKDMVEGCTYQMRNMKNVMYLGRQAWFEQKHDWRSPNRHYYLKTCGKKHIFVNIDSEDKEPMYVIESGFTRLAKKTSDEAISSYADSYETMMNSVHLLLPTKVAFRVKRIKYNYNLKGSGTNVFIKKGDKYYFALILTKEWYDDKSGYLIISKNTPFEIPKIEDGSIQLEHISYDNYSNRTINNISDKNIEEVKTFEEIQKRTFYKAVMVNKKGGKFNLMED